MREKTIKTAVAFTTLLLCVAMIGVTSAKTSDSKSANVSFWVPAEKAMGVEGELKPDSAITFSIPMTQKVTLDGLQLNEGSDRTHDFDFQKVGNQSLMVGEIGVTENKVNNVSTMVVRSGLQVTAIHNHLLRTSPHIMWIHISGYGDPAVMAKKIRSITDDINGESPVKSEKGFESKGINTSGLDRIIGKNGSVDEEDYNFDIGRSDEISMNGTVLSPAMDVSTMIHFQPIGNGSAAVIGEFVLEEKEVEPVMRTLTDNGIEVTALHSHMITEQPRLFYIHAWATGNAEELANVMRKALDRTNAEIRSKS